MTEELKQTIIDALRRGEDLPREYARELFPPDKLEYELVYHDKEREEDIIANTIAVPLQPVSFFGKNDDSWNNMLIFGDNIQVMRTLLKMKDEGKLVNADGSLGVRLIYIDPPFGTGDEYGHNDEETAYSAKMQGVKFIEFLRKRLVIMRELLSVDGSIYVRIDYHFGHYIKIIMDEIFGLHNFNNELVINRFKRQLRGLKRYNVATDSLFFYSRSGTNQFSEILKTRQCSFCGQDVDPQWLPMSSPGLRNPPERIIVGQELLPPRGRHWTFTQTKIEQMEKVGRIRIENTDSWTDIENIRHVGVPEYLQTEDTPVDSNWTDLKGYVRSARYPTENPEELLERVVTASSRKGDVVLDAFAGSGTTLAVAEKLNRNWIGIDCGKLSIYTIQKRMLNLKSEIGNKGKVLKSRPFTLYNAGLYDFSSLKKLPWADWRFFALQLFSCKDEPHSIGGLLLDGKLRGASVLVFNHIEQPGKRIDEDTIQDIHLAIGKKIGKKFFIIAPRGVFDFQQDYIDLDGVRYYALRIPYSVINELHHKDFSALKQPSDESAVNETVDAVGFDFIQPPQIEWSVELKKNKGELFDEVFLKINFFESRARIRGMDTRGGLETLSMIMIDFDFDGKVFDLDSVFYAQQVKVNDWQVSFGTEKIGEKIMVVFIDIYGNEARELITHDMLGDKILKTRNPRKKISK